LGVLVPLAGLGLAWHWWRTRRGGVALFAVGWIGLTLVPSLTIIWKITDAPLAERYLYMPSAGFCLLVGELVRRAWDAAALRRRRPALAAALAVPLLAAALATVAHNPVWRDDISLWTDTEPKSQTSGMAARGLGTAYQQAGRTSDARAAFERALQRRNSPRGLQTIHNNLGTLAMYAGDYGSARQHYETALAVNPNAPDTLFNLGLAILQGSQQSPAAAQEALQYYRRAQALNPHDPDIEAAFAQAYALLGDHAAAAQHARRALDLGASGATADSLRALVPTSH
ncbi:MAG: tetratricopeptide repeat protein, partial [Candidatus Binatia bacterium]